MGRLQMARKSKTKKEKKTSGRAKMPSQVNEQNNAGADAIVERREHLGREFPAKYSPEIGVFRDDKVEVMLKLTYSQAEALARLLKENAL
jgi:hypothetical protein